MPFGSSGVTELRTISAGFSGSGLQKSVSVIWYASSMICRAKPNAWKVSTLRAWMPSACPSTSRPSRRSTTRVTTFGNCASCAAVTMPAGPEPTISTSICSGRSAGRSTPTPAAGRMRGSVETYPW